MSGPKAQHNELTPDEFAMGLYGTVQAIQQGDMTPRDGLDLLEAMVELYPEQHENIINSGAHNFPVSIGFTALTESESK